MIQRVIRNEDNSRIEAFLENGKVWVCIRTRFGFPEFEFDNEEDIHCFISELQSAMLRAKEEPKEEESEKSERDSFVTLDSSQDKKKNWTIRELADIVAEQARERLDETLGRKSELAPDDSDDKEEKKFAVDTGEGKLVDPIDLKIPNDNFELDPTLLCDCGRVIGTDRCTRLGCDNFNAFGIGTVDTTSNGTE